MEPTQNQKNDNPNHSFHMMNFFKNAKTQFFTLSSPLCDTYYFDGTPSPPSPSPSHVVFATKISSLYTYHTIITSKLHNNLFSSCALSGQ
jgi:hypothetical protein